MVPVRLYAARGDAMIRYPAGHWFNGPIESLTLDTKNGHDRPKGKGDPGHRLA